MTTSKSSEGNTDLNKALLAHLEYKKAMGLLVALLTEEIPALYDLRYSEGPKQLQAEGICQFILRKFKTLSVDDIREAFELNAAGQLPNRTDFYGKMSLNHVGAVLSNYRAFKMNSGQRGRQEDLNVEINVERELLSDLHNLHTSGDRWNLTRYIDEKWEWLKVNKPDFKPKWEEKEITKLENEFIERRNKQKNTIIPDKWVNSRKSAEQDYKMLQIRAYLEALVPQYAKYMKEKDKKNG